MTEAIEPPLESEALRLVRRFDAPPGRLYLYFTDASHLARWFGPEGVSCEAVDWEPVVGRDYELVFTNPDDTTIGLVGRFLELEAPRLIKMTWQWRPADATGEEEVTLVTIRLSEVGEGSLLQLTHERFAETAERDRHDEGWTSSFDCLDEALSRGGSPT